MAVQFRNLPQIQTPNAQMDYAGALRPVQNALAGYTQGINRKAQLDQQKAIGSAYNQQGAPAASRMAMDAGNLEQGRAFEAVGQQQQDKLIKRYVPLAQKAASDPQWAQANWSTIMQRLQRDTQRLGINDPLDPEDMDPATGPNILLSAAGVSAADPLDRQLKEARLAQMQRAGAGATGPKFGRDGAIFQDRQGNYFTVQFADDGSRKILPVSSDGQALTPDRGVAKIDTGTGTQLIDKTTGRAIREEKKDLAGAEYQKGIGDNRAKIEAALPRAQATLTALETQHKNVKQTIDKALPMINNWTAGLAGQALSRLGGTDAANLRALTDTIRANLGFDKLQDMRDNSPTGGALGQVSEFELAMLQAAFANIEQVQSADQLRDQMIYLRGLLDKMQENRRRAFNATYGGVALQQRQSGQSFLPAAPQPSSQAPSGSFVWSPDGGLKQE